MLTFAAMAITIAALTALYCLTLCTFAHAIAAKIRAHRRAAKWLERLAGVFLIGFGIRLTTN
jgi:threonine/homoserine/homoserine lactone efflux protein